MIAIVTSLLLTGVASAADPSPDESIKFAKGLSAAFEHAAGIITPSVVNISSVKKMVAPHGRRMQDPFFDRFRDFFGDDLFDRLLPPQSPDGYAQQGLGTGVIVDDKGHILTNNHVVNDADEVVVRLQNQQTFKAEVVGTDPRSDLAVIKIKAGILTPAKLGNSENLKIGEWVIAAGNPFGLDNSITAGIVSAKGRSFIGGSQFEDFIQTDAAINPGNSGGPLVNLDGEVVGINTAIFSRSGGYMGIGFAIPIDMAKSVMESLISKGKVVRGWLGVGIQNLTESLAQSFNFPSSEGALVGYVEKGGPAEKAGLKQGDIVVAIQGKKIANVNQLRNLVAGLEPGKKVEIDYVRNGRKETSSVGVGELPTQQGEGAEQPDEADSSSTSDIGLSVETLSPELASRLKTGATRGVIVTAVRPGTTAAAAGLFPKDVILSVNGKPVTSSVEFENLLSKADLKRGLRLIVESQGAQRFVILKSDE